MDLAIIRSLKPFLVFLLSCNEDILIPILRDFAVLLTDANAWNLKMGFLKKKIDRNHLRLCRIITELGRLDFEKVHQDVSSGLAPEDYVFSRIDFSRYREITEEDFENLFFAGVTDFSDCFYSENFRLGKDEIYSLIKECYKKENRVYKLQKDNLLILSIMRTLEISLETSPLFTEAEIQKELNYLKSYGGKKEKLPNANMIYSLLVSNLENMSVTHKDGMITKIFISPQGGLSAIFCPGGKPWTRVLIPASQVFQHGKEVFNFTK